MTAEPIDDGHRGDRRSPLAKGASAAVVRSWLFPEDAERFDEELAAGGAQRRDGERGSEVAGEAVGEVVERWRAVAIAQSEPEKFRQTVRRWAEIVTGEPTPEGERFETTRARAGI